MKNKNLKTFPEDRAFKKGDLVKSSDNKIFLIEGIVLDSQTRENMVVYSELQDNYETFVESFKNFNEQILDEEKNVQKYKYEKIDRITYLRKE